MKILFFVPSLQSGGAERVISVLSAGIAERGHDVTVEMIRNGEVCYPLSDRVKTENLGCGEYRGRGPVSRLLHRLGAIRKTVKRQKPDAVISFMANTNIDVCLALFGTRVPLLVSERNDPKLDPPGRIRRFLRKIAYLRANGFVFQTPDAQNFFGKRIRKRSTVILNPLSETVGAAYSGERNARIVAVGRLFPQKNYPLLLSAFSAFSRDFPTYRLEIYGEGELKEEIAKTADSLGLSDRVSLCGFCPDVHEKIRTAAMFVMSSDYEGMPNALMEAMALGLPCISTDCPCGGPRMMIRSGENGLLVPVQDASALAEAMRSLAKDPGLAASLGSRAVDIRSRAGLSDVTDAWLSLLEITLHKEEI